MSLSSANKAVRAIGLVAACAVLATASNARATAVGTLDLGAASVVGQTARLELYLEFTSGNPLDRIELIEPSVWSSSPSLTANNTDFTRFSFDLATGELSALGWTDLDPLGGALMPHLSMLEAPLLDPGLAPRPGDPYHVGTLEVDLTGLPAAPVTVALAAGTIPATNTNLAGVVDAAFTSYAPGTNNDATDPAWLVFADPGGVTFTPGDGNGGNGDGYDIPEPVTLAAALLGLGGVLVRMRTRRL